MGRGRDAQTPPRLGVLELTARCSPASLQLVLAKISFDAFTNAAWVHIYNDAQLASRAFSSGDFLLLVVSGGFIPQLIFLLHRANCLLALHIHPLSHSFGILIPLFFP